MAAFFKKTALQTSKTLPSGDDSHSGQNSAEANSPSSPASHKPSQMLPLGQSSIYAEYKNKYRLTDFEFLDTLGLIYLDMWS